MELLNGKSITVSPAYNDYEYVPSLINEFQNLEHFMFKVACLVY